MKFDINRLSKILELLNNQNYTFQTLYTEINSFHNYYEFGDTDELNEDLQILNDAKLIDIKFIDTSTTELSITKLGRDSYSSNNTSNFMENYITSKNLEKLNSELDFKLKNLNINHLELVIKSFPLTNGLAWIGAATGILALIIEIFKSCN